MTDTGTTTDPQGPPRLVRDPQAGHWLGVAAGLARYFRIDPVLPRIAFVALTFFGGLGLLLYLALWLVMPEAHETTTPGETAAQRLRDAPTWLSVTLIVLGILWVGGIAGFSAPGLVWGLALVGLGVLLFQQDTARQAAARTASVPPPPPPPATPAGAQPATAGPARPLAPPAGPPPAPAPPPEPPRPPSILGRLTFGVALLVIGGAALLATATGTAFGPRTYLALGFVVLGAGLLVGAWWGRARWLILVGLLLVPLALATGLRALPAVTDLSVGERHWQPRTLAELQPTYDLFAGQGVIDLSRIDAAVWDGAVTGNVALGQLTVIVPEGMAVAVDASLVAGEITVFGTTDNGVFLDVRRGASTADADLVLNLRGAFGQLEVMSASARSTTPDGNGPLPRRPGPPAAAPPPDRSPTDRSPTEQSPTDRSPADQDRLR